MNERSRKNRRHRCYPVPVKTSGETGKVLAVSPNEGKVIVEGRNMVKKHVKPRRHG